MFDLKSTLKYFPLDAYDFSLEREIRMKKLQINHLLLQSHDPMALINSKMIVTHCNQPAVGLFGFKSKEELLGRATFDMLPAKKTAHSVYTPSSIYFKKAMTEGFQRFEWQHQIENGCKKTIEVTLIPIIYLDNKYIQVVWRDLTELKKTEYTVKKLAYFDALTTLPNKNVFIERVTHLLNIASQNNYTVAVVYLELENLPIIKDSLGMAAGDAIVKAVSQRILNSICDNSVIYQDCSDHYNFQQTPHRKHIDKKFDCLAYVGHGLFALTAVLSASDTASFMVNRLQGLFKTPFNIFNSQITVNTIAGVSICPKNSKKPDNILQKAQLALIQAKKSNLPYCYFNFKIGQQAQQKAQVIQQLEKTILQQPHKISARFQPQIDLNSGSIAGVHISLHWYDDTLGRIPPDVFMPYAEEFGLIKQLNMHTIELLDKSLDGWINKNNKESVLNIFLNFSASSFDKINFTNRLKFLIKKHTLSNVHFYLKVTGSCFKIDPDKSIKIFNALKAQGFKLSVDYISTGYSSLNILKDLEIDILSIDAHLIESMLTDTRSLAVVKTAIATAKIFGIKTLAEGIKHQDSAYALTDLGCDYGQGSFISNPLTLLEFEKNWLGSYEVPDTHC